MKNQPEQHNQPLLRQKITEQFPQEDLAQVLALLNQYESASAAGRLRVQLAILKLSQGNVDKLREYVAVARTDYRDVLFWAETPEQAKAVKVRVPQQHPLPSLGQGPQQEIKRHTYSWKMCCKDVMSPV